MTANEKFLNVRMLSGYIHVSTSAIYKWVSNDTIPHIKLSSRTLFEKEEIDRWILSHGQANDELPELPAV